MNIQLTTSVGSIALHHPQSIAIFERHRIDFCCGGSQSLAAACEDAHVDPATLLQSLQTLASEPEAHAQTSFATLTELTHYLVQKHHTYTRKALAHLQPLLAKIARVHSVNHPEWFELSATFNELANDLEGHLIKEEQVLFPLIESMESASGPMQNHCGSVANPISVMLYEHDQAGTMLKRVRTLTRDYTVPDDGCNSVRAAFEGLRELEADLHRHIHLENNELFPRAKESERR